ncbi:MAG: peptide deformylase [Armatimonadota bacterium]
MSSPTKQLSIVRYGDPALRTPAQKIGRVTAGVKQLAEQMLETMRAAGGVGLAANQIGVPQRLVVIEVEGEVSFLVDPAIARTEGTEVADEGCLSLPRLYGAVARPTRVTVKARDLSGRRITLTGEGLLARALCHELDHLNGKLFIDSADKSTLYWLLGHDEDGQPITQPTTLEEALKVFTTAGKAHG